MILKRKEFVIQWRKFRLKKELYILIYDFLKFYALFPNLI